ncbi:MAG: amidohydrolase [Clostridia bacterium]|nr:amidohydrolase [Clostridia bacterium]
MTKKTLFYNGQIITVNKNNDVEEAMLVEDNRISCVGKTVEALRLADKYTEWVDLHGCAVVPGFVDCHIHMAVAGARIPNQIDVSKKAGVDSVSELLNKLKAGNTSKDEWIIGSSYSHESLDENRHVTLEELDNAFPDIPVLIIHTSGHMSVANTKALDESRLNLDTEGVMKDGNGRANGLLIENAHFSMLEKSPVLPSDEELISGIERFSKMLASKGITSAHDAGGFGTATFRTLQKAKDRGVLLCRTYPMLWSLFGKSEQLKTAENAIDSGFYTGLGDDFLKIGPIKLMADGSAVGGTCAVSKPLLHLDATAPASFSQKELDEVFVEGHRRGFQLTAHAVGDKAIEMVIAAYEKAMTLYPRKDSRHRIEHCFLMRPDLFEKIKTFGIIPVPNPGFLSVWGGVFEKYYSDRIERVMPLKTFRDMGVITPFGSDAMVIEEYEPLFGIAAAMERRDLKSGRIIGEEQRIDFMHALRCYTYFGAYASFEENEKGSLAAGKLADFVILSDGVLKKTPDELRKTKVCATYIDGRKIFG